MIRDLRLEALKKEPHAFKDSFKDEITLSKKDWQERISNSCEKKSHEFFILAKIQEKIVGIAGAIKKDGEVWNIKSVFVRHEYRGQRIGRRLLEALIWKLDHIHMARKIELIVNTKQEAAIALYKKCGFVVVETRDNQKSGDGNMYTKFVMDRKLCSINIKCPELIDLKRAFKSNT